MKEMRSFVEVSVIFSRIRGITSAISLSIYKVTTYGSHKSANNSSQNRTKVEFNLITASLL